MKFSVTQKKLLSIILITVFILAVTAGTYLFIRSYFNRRRSERFDTVLTEATNLLAEGYSTEAIGILDSLQNAPGTSTDYLKLLKRYLIWGEMENEFNPFLSFARKVGNEFPGRQDIRALIVWGLLKTARYEEAAGIASSLTEPTFESIKAESILRLNNEMTPESVKEQGLENNPYISVMVKQEPEIFVFAGDKTGISEYYLDAALLFMGQGRIRIAESILRNHLGSEYPRFGLFLSVDSDRFSSSMDYLDIMDERNELSPETELIKGDLLIRAGKLNDAEEFYGDYLARYPQVSWIPYYNFFLLIDMKSNDSVPVAGRNILEKGLSVFPGQEELSFLLARDYLLSGEDSRAEEVLNSLVNEGQGGYKAELALISLFSGRRSPEYVIGRYWEIINSYPDAQEPERVFGHYLLAWSQWDDLDLLLNRVEAHGGRSGWSCEFRGIADAMNGNTDAGIEYLEKALELETSPYRYYNLALLYEQENNLKMAGELLEKGLALVGEGDVSGSESNSSLEGKMRIHLAVILYKNHDPHAETQLNQGLLLNPGDLEGLYYRKIIKDVLND